MSQPDGLTAYLTSVRERSERPLSHVTSLPIGHDGVRTLMESAADVPRLLAAVEVSRKYHWPEYTSWGDVCGGCWTAGSAHPVWPCPPMVDLVNALMGE